MNNFPFDCSVFCHAPERDSVIRQRAHFICVDILPMSVFPQLYVTSMPSILFVSLSELTHTFTIKFQIIHRSHCLAELRIYTVLIRVDRIVKPYLEH